MSHKVSYIELIQQIFAFYLMGAVIIIASNVSTFKIIHEMPLVGLLLFSFIYVHNTIHIQVSHVTLDTYVPWSRVYIMNVISLLYFTVLSIFFQYLFLS